MATETALIINAIGTACFGAVIGWCVYYSLIRWENYSPSQLGVLITAVLGGVVSTFFTGIYNVGAYGIGVAIGFFSFAYWARKDGRKIFMVKQMSKERKSLGQEVPDDEKQDKQD